MQFKPTKKEIKTMQEYINLLNEIWEKLDPQETLSEAVVNKILEKEF